MSYEHLAERLIAAQQTMLGKRAIDIAASVEGLTVEDDGSVTAVADDDREVIAALVAEYTTIMGDSAASRLESTAAEFEDDLVLPENLGGPETLPEDADTEPAPASEVHDETAETAGDRTVESADEAAADQSSDRAGDSPADQPVRKATNPPTVDDITEPDETEQSSSAPKASPSGGSVVESHDSVTELWTSDEEATSQSATAETADAGTADAESEAQAEGAATTDSTGAESSESPTDPAEMDIDSVYVTRTDENGWETPVPVGKAVADAVTDATDVPATEIDDLAAYVDTDRVVNLLETDRSIPVSFRVEGHSVTLHPDGDVTVE